MNRNLISTPSSRDQLQGRLLSLAAVFLFFFALVLTLSPAVRLHTWAVSYRWEHWTGYAVWLLGFFLIHRQLAHLLPDRDPYLLPIAALLIGWGLLTVWRLDTTLGLRQTIWLAVSLLAFYLGLRLPDLLGLLRRYKYLELTGGLLLTALTFIFGVYPSGDGPHLWLGCCGLYFQPSEPLKLLLIVYLAAYLAGRMPVSFRLLELLAPTLVLTGAALVILIAQRDLGTASVFIFLYAVILYLVSGRRRIVVISAAAMSIAGLLGYQLFDVIRIRIDAWLNPWLDPSGRSYQVVQSIISVASGGVLGSGPGIGSPGLVPVAHSDFIFSAIAEETGLLGAVAILTLLALLAARGLRAALCASSAYQRYLAAGLSAFLVGQAILIIAGNLRLLPLTGVTLPFVSQGGSSLLTSILSLLILTLVSATGENEPAPLPAGRRYLYLGSVLLAGLAAIALAAGWWGFIRSEDLQTRTDNPRRFINDRYVRRGALLDRENRLLSTTQGEPGSYTRRYVYPPLAATIGYTNAAFGQAGLEASQDPYLRGVAGSPASQVWSSRLLYGQDPPGLNVRLALDLELQTQADELLAGHPGALVMLNATTGEILALASHPNFDPNRIDELWDQWISDPASPLLNRATQGQYAPGTATAPFLLALAAAQGDLPPLPEILSMNIDGQTLQCAATPPPAPTWEWALANGCPGAIAALSEVLSANQLENLYQTLGLYQAPAVPLPVAEPSAPSAFQDLARAAAGQEDLLVSPLQMALAAASITTGGQQPAPRLVSAVETLQQGWVVLPSADPQPVLPDDGAATAANLLAVTGQPYWQTTATALDASGPFTWYLGGVLPGTRGTPITLALVLEEHDPDLANNIGLTLLRASEQP